MDNKRLLVMDDDASVGEVAASMAEAMGAEARVVTTVDALLKAIDEWSPTHIAMDLVMPGTDGIEVMNLLARRKCRARVIVCSGMGDSVLDAAMRAARDNGLNVAGVLPKPFSLRELKGLLADPIATATTSGARPADSPPPAAKAAPGVALTEGALRRALLTGEIFPIYQPKIDCSSGEVVGIDASARWRHPQAGLLAPDSFIGLAEKFGLIDELTESMAEQAMEWLSRAAPAGWLGLTLKLSAASLGSARLLQSLQKSSRQHDLDCRRITLQLSETAAMSNTTAVLEMLTRLRMQGFEISLGHYGAGQTSLMHLVRLPISELVIDTGLTTMALNNREARVVCNCIVDLGNSLHLRVTASGIETGDTLQLFSQIGIHAATGFFIAPQMEGDAMQSWMVRWKESIGSRWQLLLNPRVAREP